MGTLVARGTGRLCPPQILLSAILPSLMAPACLLRPISILKAPSVAWCPPQIWGMGLQLYSKLHLPASPSALLLTWYGWLGERY